MKKLRFAAIFAVVQACLWLPAAPDATCQETTPPDVERSASEAEQDGAQTDETPSDEVQSDDVQSEEAQQEDTRSAVEVWQSMRQRSLEIDKEINEIYGNLTIGMLGKQEQQLKRVDRLRAEKERLVLEILEASIEAFRESEEINPQAGREMMMYANACLVGNMHRFPVNPEKSLGICELAIEKGADTWGVRLLAAQAAYAAQQFERASEHANECARLAPETGKPLVDELERTIAKWKIEQEFEFQDLPRVTIRTNIGDITCELFEDEAPQAVRNFIWLIDQRHYDGLEFFDVQRGEFCRAGCKSNDGNSQPPFVFVNESQLANAHTIFSGYLCAVPADRSGQCGPQFIITQKPVPRLNGSFPVFGRVVEGMDVVKSIYIPAINKLDGSPELVQIETIEVVHRRDGTEYMPEMREVNNDAPAAPDTSTDSQPGNAEADNQ